MGCACLAHIDVQGKARDVKPLIKRFENYGIKLEDLKIFVFGGIRGLYDTSERGYKETENFLLEREVNDLLVS